MLFLLPILYCETFSSVQSQLFSSEEIQTGNQRVVKSTRHRTDVTQAGPNIKAHETFRNLINEATPKQTKSWHSLIKKTGVKNQQTAKTEMEKAMGFSEQFTGQLNVTKEINTPNFIAGVPFYPNEEPTTNISKIFCDDGRCTHSMSDIT